MTRPAPFSSATAGLALALFAASGLAACAGGPVADEIPPVVLTEQDGVVRGPDEGATPVQPPSPAPAGSTRTELGARDEAPPPPTTGDDPEPPPPVPDEGAVGDDDAGDVRETEAPVVDDPPDEEEDSAGDDGEGGEGGKDGEDGDG